MASFRTFLISVTTLPGALYDVTSFSNAAPFLTDPRTFGPGKPFAIYAGLKYTL